MGNKPKLIRQTAILADGDSTGSGKSVTFQEPAGIGSVRRFVASAADLGTCPLHSHERYKLLYDKLAETARAQAAVVTPEEESDMEASDVEDEVPNVNSDSLPLGTTFRTMYVQDQQMLAGNNGQTHLELQEEPKLPTFIPRRLSTISSQDRESIPNIDEEQEELAESEQPDMGLGLQPEMPEDPLLPKPDTEVVKVNKTTEAEVHDAKLLNQTDFEWHPDTNESDEQSLAPPGAEMVASEAAADGDDPESEALLSEKRPQKSSEIDTATTLLPSTSVVQPARIGSRYKNTHV